MYSEKELKKFREEFQLKNSKLHPKKDFGEISRNQFAIDCINCILTKEIPSHVTIEELKDAAESLRFLSFYSKTEERRLERKLQANLIDEVIFVMRTT